MRLLSLRLLPSHGHRRPQTWPRWGAPEKAKLVSLLRFIRTSYPWHTDALVTIHRATVKGRGMAPNSIEEKYQGKTSKKFYQRKFVSRGKREFFVSTLARLGSSTSQNFCHWHSQGDQGWPQIPQLKIMSMETISCWLCSLDLVLASLRNLTTAVAKVGRAHAPVPRLKPWKRHKRGKLFFARSLVATPNRLSSLF